MGYLSYADFVFYEVIIYFQNVYRIEYKENFMVFEHLKE